MIAYRAAGKQRWESFRTLDEARRAKAARVADIARGEFHERTKIALHTYAREWVERGSHGIREVTRDEYRRQLEQYALGYFPERLKLSDLSPARVAAFIAWLCDGTEQAKHEHRRAVERAGKAGKPEPAPLAADATRTLSDATVRRIMAPLRACLASAVDEGLIRSNPATGRKLPTRPQGGGGPRGCSRAQPRAAWDAPRQSSRTRGACSSRCWRPPASASARP